MCSLFSCRLVVVLGDMCVVRLFLGVWFWLVVFEVVVVVL